MPDGRFLSKSIAYSEQVGAVSFEADYLFARMIPHLDSAGRMIGSPRAVKAMCCPLRDEITPQIVERCLRELHDVGLIAWYTVGGSAYIEFPGFAKHQRGARLDREAPSRIPPRSDDAPAPTPDAGRTNSGAAPEQLRVSKEKGSEVKSSEVCPAAPDGAPEPDPGGKKPRKRPHRGKPAVPPDTRAGGWVGDAHAMWCREIGAVEPGHLGRWFKPIVEAHGWPVVEKALHEYAWQTEGQKRSPRYFADDIVRWIRESNEPLVDPITGWLTPKGERLTRPAA